MRKAGSALVLVLAVLIGLQSHASATQYLFRYDPPSEAEYADARPGDVVVVGQEDDGAAAQRIHARGALAFRYVQYYWAPTTREYQGSTTWAPFCANGVRQLDTTVHGNPWGVVDLNERSQRNAANRYLRSLKTAGYDGVFFDMGGMSMLGPLSGTVSSCTIDPVVRGRTLAQAAVAEYGQARALGLKVAFNGGPLDALYRSPVGQSAMLMRPAFIMDEAGARQNRLAIDRWFGVALGFVPVILVRPDLEPDYATRVTSIRAAGLHAVVDTHLR